MKNEESVLEKGSVEEHGREVVVGCVREYVSRAAELLRTLGPDYERVSWLIEDTLVYVYQVEAEAHAAMARSCVNVAPMESLEGGSQVLP